MDLAAWSIETSSAKVKQMPFSVGTLLEICSSDKIYGSMNKKRHTMAISLQSKRYQLEEQEGDPVCAKISIP